MHNTISNRGKTKMPITSKKQSEAKQEWMKNNSKMFGVRVMRNTEADIFEYLEGKVPSEEFKKGIRLLIAQEEAKKAAHEKNQQ